MNTDLPIIYKDLLKQRGLKMIEKDYEYHPFILNRIDCEYDFSRTVKSWQLSVPKLNEMIDYLLEQCQKRSKENKIKIFYQRFQPLILDDQDNITIRMTVGFTSLIGYQF